MNCNFFVFNCRNPNDARMNGEYSATFGSSLQTSNLFNLSHHLHAERLYVNSEKAQLQELIERGRVTSEKLFQTAWITRQQRQHLDGLIYSRLASPSFACQKDGLLGKTVFIDAHKILSYQEAIYSAFLRQLRVKPDLLANVLSRGEKSNKVSAAMTSDVICTIFSGLYGSCLMSEDERLVERLMQRLLTLQLVPSDNPRKLLRQGNSAFSQVYKAFHEEIFSAKLFLTAALYEPILCLLTDDEIFLDIDPSKVFVRFAATDLNRKFGSEDGSQFSDRVSAYRATIIGKLKIITDKFISGISDNLHCFPPSLLRLLHLLQTSLTAVGRPVQDVYAICVDIVFCMFICPAMVDPNPMGIIDAPISYIARSNLMQVAQILQVLAMQKWDRDGSTHNRCADLYSSFANDSVSSIVENILSMASSSSANVFEESAVTSTPAPRSIPIASGSAQLTRSHFLVTKDKLEQLVNYLRMLNDNNQTELEDILKPLPDKISAVVNAYDNSTPNHTQNSPKTVADVHDSPKSKKPLMSNNRRSSGFSRDSGQFEPEIVLLLHLLLEAEPPGFLSEEAVLASHQRSVRMNLEKLPGDDITANRPNSTENSSVVSNSEVVEKRTRFSVSHDGDGSIGNTSDNLEVISEAASNHSVESSMEDDEPNQNDVDADADAIIDSLSDMVSANVSGHGTPNISGRDTPSSQVTEDEDPVKAVNPNNIERLPIISNSVPPSVENSETGRKSGEPDLEEKFGRFEIKKPPLEGGDETVSMISDTWSTDVLASDMETLPGESIGRQIPPMNLGGFVMPPSGEAVPPTQFADMGLDNASEAWSMDVVASDTESLRLAELDEETASVTAQSDDTNRSFFDSDDVTQRNRGQDGGDRGLPSRDDAVEQWARQAVGASSSGLRRGSDSVPNPAGNVKSSSSQVTTPASVDRNTSKLSSHQSIGSIESSSGSSTGGQESVSAGATWAGVPKNRNLNAVSSSTGAIPKSISFEKGAILTDSPSKSNNNVSSKIRRDRSFFKSWKLPKIGGGSGRNQRKNINGGSDSVDSSILEFGTEVGTPVIGTKNETMDEILARYRHKPATISGSVEVEEESVSLNEQESIDDERLIIDPFNIEGSYAFQDAKRKLRMMLAEADLLEMLPRLMCNKEEQGRTCSIDNELVWFLKAQLAEAHNLQDRNLVAQLHETLRCVSLFDPEGCRRLIRGLRSDYKRRAPYLAYLVRTRQHLLATQARQEKLLTRLQVDQKVCSQYLVSVCIRLFLEKYDTKMQNFVNQFKRLTMSDEKTELMELFLAELWCDVEQDPSFFALSNGPDQSKLAKLTIERAVMSQIYMQAMYPNDEADIFRDEVLTEHIARLSKFVTPGHTYLRIPRKFHYEQPWPSAQEEIRRLAVYKTPADKVACVVRCSRTIMNLLSLSSLTKSVPAADDFMPVIVFVLIKANPPSLLSTVQFVEGFYGNRLSGEDQYWWMQFVSSIEYIKTLDYTK